MKTELIYPELSYLIMGVAFEVHSVLGTGFIESLYENALAIEFKSRGIAFERQKKVTVQYKDVIIGRQKLDFIIEGKIVLEIKATVAISDVYKMKVLSYLRATDLRLGIIINFGTPKVQSVRVVN